MSAQTLTDQQIEEKEQEAREMVHQKSLYSSIAAALPIPLLDVGTDMKLMKDIKQEAEEIFGFDHNEVNELSDDLMNRAAVMATSIGSEFIGSQTTKILLKRVTKNSKMTRFGLIPIVSKVLGAAISYKMMQKLGNDYVDKCVEIARKQTV